MDVFAHRGSSSESPENTLAAFRQVRETGAQGVEFDVQLTRDGVPVVIHDEQVNRTSDGKGWVRDLTLAQVRALDAGRWYGADFAGERIPTFAEVLDLFRGSSLMVNIELKTNRVPYPGLAKQVIQMVEKLGMNQQVMITSFNHQTLQEARAIAPGLEYGVLMSDQMIEPWRYVQQYGFTACHPRASAVDEELVSRCHALGQKVRPWVVDDPEEFARLKGLGVDAVISNHPRRFART